MEYQMPTNIKELMKFMKDGYNRHYKLWQVEAYDDATNKPNGYYITNIFLTKEEAQEFCNAMNKDKELFSHKHTYKLISLDRYCYYEKI